VGTAAGPATQDEQSGHRERLIAALAASIEEAGFRETTVADVVRIARTSRRNYYEHFTDRDACFLALFEASYDAILQRIAEAVRPDLPWQEQVDDALGAYLDTVAARPALWQSFVRELPSLGEPGAACQRVATERFAELLVGLVESGRREQPELGMRSLAVDMAIMIVGGLRELTVIALDQGRDVRDLRPVAAQTVKAILSETIL
jgi:AcrR family transcriptional regulator